jgi:hypothetical protein
VLGAHPTPADLGNADGGENRSVECPADIVDHEALHDRRGPDAYTLHHPNGATQNHQRADEARHDPHDDVEPTAHDARRYSPALMSK